MTEKLALITGASRGLGFAFGVELASRGWHILAVARTTGGLEELDDQIKALPGNSGATLAPMDVTNDDAMRHLCRSTYDRWGHADLWIHTAVHAPPLAPAAHVDAKDWDKSIATNVRATGILIPMVEPLLRAAEAGAALFLDDPRAGEKFFGAYGSTKASQIALARSWQAETVRTGPRVLIETPAPMPTATRARFFPGEDRDALTNPKAEAARIIGAILG
ncbi:MAG: oxidoreductase [Cereibacter sphaeroides]|uniref:Oxidoreductase n=1 Tax=Cereibacter sphaeroides TaxID=1063 RepID=A0A2W5SAE7_CERSP|nr:MAG: oxidoreductase [Cereibacter sphaeroides]